MMINSISAGLSENKFSAQALPKIYEGYTFEVAGQSVAVAPGLTKVPLAFWQQLSTQRIAGGWTIASLSDRLKLSPKQIQALESGHWESLPKGSLLKAMVRSYCRAIGVEASPIIAELPIEESDLSVQIQSSKGIDTPFRRVSSKPTRKTQVWWLWLGLFILLLLVWIGFGTHEIDWPDMQQLANLKALKPSQAETAKPVSIESVPTLSENPEVIVSPALDPASVTTPSESAVLPASTSNSSTSTGTNEQNQTNQFSNSTHVAVTATTQTTAVPSTVVPTVKLESKPVVSSVMSETKAPKQNAESPQDSNVSKISLNFKQTSWVEVRQINGKIVFSGIRKIGDQVVIEDTPPFLVVVGNAAGVELRYRGQVVELQAASEKNVARVTLE